MMAFSYKPLWVLLAKHGESKTEFRQNIGIGTNQLAKMGKGEYVSLEVLDKICNHYGVQPNDVIEHIKDEE